MYVHVLKSVGCFYPQLTYSVISARLPQTAERQKKKRSCDLAQRETDFYLWFGLNEVSENRQMFLYTA